MLRCCVGSILGRKTSQNWIGAFQDSCCPVASLPEIMVEKKGHVKISVAVLRRKFFRSEDFSKFGLCISKFLLRCSIAPRILGGKKGACEFQWAGQPTDWNADQLCQKGYINPLGIFH